MVEKGLIYVLTNDSFKSNIVKIGKTKFETPDKRIRELSGTTGVPTPFKCFFAIFVDDIKAAEDDIHDLFDDYRINPKREFFQIDPEIVKRTLKGTYPSNKEYTKLEGKQLDEEAHEVVNEEYEIHRRSRFSFKKLGISVGSELVFTRDNTKKCIVKDDEHSVIYNNKTYSLTRLSILLDKQLNDTWIRNNNGGVQGTAYWKYNNKTIKQLNEEYDDGHVITEE